MFNGRISSSSFLRDQASSESGSLEERSVSTIPSEPNAGFPAPSTVAPSVKTPGSSFRVTLLLSVILVQVLILLWLVPKDPLLMVRIQSILHPSASSVPRPNVDAGMLRHDPAIGMQMPMDGAGRSIRSIAPKSKTGYLVVSVGDCASCIAADIKSWQAEASRNDLTTILIASAPPGQAQQFRHTLGVKAPIISDLDGHLTHTLNVVWPGRAYLFSPQWRLRWLQRTLQPQFDPFEDRRFLTALEGR